MNKLLRACNAALGFISNWDNHAHTIGQLILTSSSHIVWATCMPTSMQLSKQENGTAIRYGQVITHDVAPFIISNGDNHLLLNSQTALSYAHYYVVNYQYKERKPYKMTRLQCTRLSCYIHNGDNRTRMIGFDWDWSSGETRNCFDAKLLVRWHFRDGAGSKWLPVRKA